MIRSFHDWEWCGYRQIGANIDLFLRQPDWMNDDAPRDHVLRLVDVQAFALSEMWAGIAIVSAIEAWVIGGDQAALVQREIGPLLGGAYRPEDIERLIGRASEAGHVYVTMAQSYGGNFCAICRSVEGGLPVSIAA